MEKIKSLIKSIIITIILIILFLGIFKITSIYRGPKVMIEDKYLREKDIREGLEEKLASIDKDTYVKKEKKRISEEVAQEKKDIESTISRLELEIKELKEELKGY